MVFKFETVVATLIAFITISFAQAGSADETTTQEKMGRSCSDLDYYATSGYDDKGRALTDAQKASFASQAAECYKRSGTAGLNGSADCGTVEGEFNTAEKEFAGACGAANISSASPKTGNIACGYSLARCDCLSNGTDGAEPFNPICEGGEAETPRAFSTKDSGALELLAEKKTLEMCPSRASLDLANLKADEKALREAIPGMKERIGSMKEERAEAAAQSRQTQSDKRAEMVKAGTDHEKELLEIQNQADAETKQLMAEVTAKQNQLLQIEANVRQADFEDAAAFAEYQEKLTQVDLQCYQSASQTVAKLQQEFIANGQKPRGDFNDFLKNVGATSRKQWQLVAKKYYTYCKNSSPTAALRKAALTEYEGKRAAVTKSKTDIAAQKKALEDEINKFIGGDCTGDLRDAKTNTPKQNQNCTVAGKLVEQRKVSDDAFNADMAAKTIDLKNEAAEASRKYNEKTRQIADAERDLADEQTRLKNLKELVELKKAKSNGVQVEENKAAEARHKMGELTSVASRIVTCTEASKCDTTAVCKKARSFLESVGAPVPEFTPVDSNVTDIPPPGGNLPATVTGPTVETESAGEPGAAGERGTPTH